MRIRTIQIKSLFSLISVSILQCNCELPANSYGPPSKNGAKPSPIYGPPSRGPGGKGPSNLPGSNYGPPPSPDIKPPSSGGPNSSDGDSENGEAKPEPFSFMYEVKDAATGNDFSHKQESDGKTVRGEYKVLLPDGRNQVVTYIADEGGYNAEVKYDGEAQSGRSPDPASGLPPGGGSGYPTSPFKGKSPGGGNSGYPSTSLPGGGNPFEGYPPAGSPTGGGSGYPRNPAGSLPGGTPPQNSYLPPSGGGYK